MQDEQLIADAVVLWRANGGPTGEIRTEPCTAGGNNRVFVLAELDGAARVVVKSYFRDGGPKRLQAEYLFLKHAENAGVANAPRALARDDEKLLSLHQFVEGRKLGQGEIGEKQVLAAANFICALNAQSGITSGANLLDAAEACFSIGEHVFLIDRRLERLSSVEEAAAAGVIKEITAYWKSLRQSIIERAAILGLTVDQKILRRERVISPSDFGFHNALANDNGDLTFIDFEYAGWDDIAKLAADFFFQPSVPVDSALFEVFMNRIVQDIPNKTGVKDRIRLLRPIFGVKWCCIMLNCFLPDMAARKKFADPGQDDAQYKSAQLAKAETALQTLVDTPWHT
jgi:hypothetical protein